MRRAPDWTAAEFEILLQNPTLCYESLHLKLPGRTTAAVQIVRSGIHAFHSGLNTSMLSKLMISRLKNDTSGFVCPICGIEVGFNPDATDFPTD